MSAMPGVRQDPGELTVALPSPRPRLRPGRPSPVPRTRQPVDDVDRADVPTMTLTERPTTERPTTGDGAVGATVALAPDNAAAVVENSTVTLVKRPKTAISSTIVGLRPRPSPRPRHLVPALPGPRPRPAEPDFDPARRVAELLERVRPVAERAVDRYELAASLESDGITDTVASSYYGHRDVFALAQELLSRVRTMPPAATAAALPRTVARRWSGAVRDVTHGLLYLLPAAVFPVGISLLERDALVIGVLLVGAVGWIWSGTAAWLAYQLLGHGFPGSAARLLRLSALGGIPLAALTCLAVIMVTGTTSGLLAVGIAQMAFQAASGVLMFYRREQLLFLALAPAVGVGIAFLVLGSAVAQLAYVVIAGSLALALGFALLQTRHRDLGPEPGLLVGLRRESAGLPAVVLYIGLSAAFLLHAQSLFMLEHFEVLVAFLPLLVGMGVVEWRTRRFSENARALLHTLHHPRDFVGRVWRLLARNVAVCAVSVGALSAVLIVVLYLVAALTPGAVVLTLAGVVLSAAYFVGFLLANMRRYGWLSGSLALCTAVQIGAVNVSRWELGPFAETQVLLGSAVLLLVLYMWALAGRLGQVRSFR